MLAVMSPGQYLRRRREAAGLSLDDVALMTETTPPVCARSRGEWFALVEQDRSPVTGDIVDTLLGAFAFDRHVLVQLVAIYAGAEIDAPTVCRHCACSWKDACVEECGQACAWSLDDKTLCTACQHAGAAGASTVDAGEPA